MKLLQKSLSETETVKESMASGYNFSIEEEKELLELPMPNYKLL